MRLDTRVPLRPGELLHGYAGRLARACLTDLATFCSDLDFKLMGLVVGHPSDVARLAELTGEPQAALAARALVGNRRGRSLWGERLVRNELRCMELLVCPACLAEDIADSYLPPDQAAYFRAEWIVRSITTCPKHRLALQSVDNPEKGWAASRFHDIATRIAGCLGSLDVMLHDAEIREATGFERYLIDRLRGEGVPTPLLYAVPFDAAIDLCETFGAVALFGRHYKIRSLSVGDVRAARDRGFQILSGGESAVRAMLRELQRSFTHNSAWNEGPRAIYGAIYRSLSKMREAEDSEPIRAIVREHVLETTSVAAGTVILGRTIHVRRLHSLASAAKELGRPRLQLRTTLANAGLLPDGHEQSPPSQVLFDAQAFERIKYALKHGMRHQEAANHINLSASTLRSLAWGGLLPHTVLGEGSSLSRIFQPADLDRFVEHLAVGAHEIHAIPEGAFDIASVSDMLRKAVAVVVRLIMDRELAWVGRSPAHGGCKGIFVRLEEVRNLITQKRQFTVARPTEPNGTRFRLGRMKALVEHGVLKTLVTDDHGRPKSVESLTREEIDLLIAECMTIGEFGSDWGIACVDRPKIIAWGKPEPILPLGTTKYPIYLRKDLETACLGWSATRRKPKRWAAGMLRRSEEHRG